MASSWQEYKKKHGIETEKIEQKQSAQNQEPEQKESAWQRYKRENGTPESNPYLRVEIQGRNQQRQKLQEQKKYIDNFVGPTMPGQADAMEAAYYREQAALGAKWKSADDYRREQNLYRNALQRATAGYNAELSRREQERQAEEEKLSGLYTALKRDGDLVSNIRYLAMLDRYSKDGAFLQQMGTDAARMGSYGLYDRANKANQGALNSIAGAYSDYRKEADKSFAAKLEHLKTEDPESYLAYTSAAEDVEKKLTELEQQKAEMEGVYRHYYDEWANDSTSKSAEEHEAKEKAFLDFEAKLNQVNANIEVYKKAQRYHKNQKGKALYEQYLGGGKVLDPESVKKIDEGKARYEADRQAAIAKGGETLNYGLNIFAKARGVWRGDKDRLEEAGWDPTFDTAANLRSEDENTFYALYADDPKKAMDFITYANNYRNDQYEQWMSEWAHEDGWNATGAFFQALGNRIGSGAVNLVDPHSAAANQLARTGSSLLAGGAQLLNEWSGTIDTDIPILRDLFNGKGLGDFYQLANSVLESGINAYVAGKLGAYIPGGGAEGIAALGTMIMGSSASAADYNECIKRGLTPGEAQKHALAAGINEALFEFVSMDKLLDTKKLMMAGTMKDKIKAIFIQSGVEASEEFCTTVANRLADGAQARRDGYDSQIEHRAKELIAMGRSRDEALEMAEKEWLTELINDAIGGFISGGLHDAGALVATAPMRAVSYVRGERAMNRSYGQSTSDAQQAAMRAYAADNGIAWNSTENGATVQNTQTETEGADSSPTAQNDNEGQQTQEQPKTRQEKRQERREEKAQAKSEREIGADVRRVQEHIDKQLAGKTVQEQTAIRDKLVQQYGEAFAPAVYSAVQKEAMANAAQYPNAEAIRRAKEAALEGVTDQEMRQVVSSAYDKAAVDLALQTRNTDALGRYYQQLRGTGTGTMTMEAIVKGQDGQETRSAITGMSNDGKHVTMADGSTVAVKELQADADTMDIIHEISALGLGKNTDKVFQAYKKSGKTGLDGYRWIMDYTTAIDQGRNRRISLQEAIKRSSLDAETVMEAYEMGHKETMDETRKAVQKNENRPKRKGVTGRVANIDTSAIQNEPMSKQEREQFDLANQIFEILGVDVKWESSKTRNGKYVGANGSYLNGAITLDIHAGRNDVIRDINSGILATTGHELTHFLQEYAPEQYQALKEFVLQQIVKNGKYGEATLDRMIQDKQNRSSKKLTKSQAEDEVVADACQTMLRDSKALREFAEKKPGAAKEMIRWLADWFKKIKAAFSRSAQLSDQARFMENLEKDVREAFGKLWDDALREAVRVHDEVGNIEKATTEGESKEESTAQNSDRDAEYLEAVESNEDWKVEKMVRDAAVQWGAATDERGKPIPLYHGTPRFGFTVFKDPAHEVPFIYTSTNPTVSAHYAGDKNYAGRRPIGRKYRTGTKTEDIIENAKWVYESNYHVMSTEEKLKAYKEIEKQAIEIAEKLDEVHIGAWNAESESFKNMPDEVANAISWVEDMFWTIRDSDYKFNFDGKEDYPGERAEFFKVLDSDIENAKTQRAIVQEFYDENRKNLSKQEKAFLSYLLSYEVGDAAIDIEYKLRRVATENDVIMNEAGNINNPLDLKESMDMYHETGAYTLYGNLGDNPFIFDANGAQFWGVKVPEMGDGYYSTDSISKWAYENGYTGVVMKNIYDYGDKADNYVFFNSSQLKSADPVTYDDSGNVIPLSERFNPEQEDIRYSEREDAAKANVDLDLQSESAAPEDGMLYSERTWSESRFVKDKENAANALAKALNVSVKKAKKYIDDINSVAKIIADDRARLDYLSSPGRSAFKSNAEYGGSIDFSTLCKKRQLMTGTFNAIQHALANTVLTADDVLRLRKMMQDAGLEVSCGLCYVEGSRARMGEYNKTFLELYKKYFQDNWQPKMEDVNTTDGLELMRMEHPECYEQYEYFYNNHGTLRSEDKAIFSSQAKPKEYQLRTEYKGEIRDKFRNETNVKSKNDNGGMRLQSFSDFEIVHLIDCMQVIMDMSEVGLAGQAYTKVPEFAEALGMTGLKINLSLIAKGVDENGKLIYNDVEGMPHERAFGIRDKYSENVGTILVVYDDAQLTAAMADDKVDFIIPFHRSQWRKSQYAAMGLPSTTKDYTYQQNEKWLNPSAHTHEYRGKTVPTKCTNYMPNEYWDFSLSGTENARRYLEMCAKDGKRPKFYKLLQNNGDGSFSLKADGSTDGYWKLLIDFKMYDNEGKPSPQMPVQPIFDMESSMKMLDDYSGDPSRFPVAQGIVDEFVAQYKDDHPGRQYSERDYETPTDTDLLMNASESAATNPNQLGLLKDYKALGKRAEILQKRLDALMQEKADREASGKEYKAGYLKIKGSEIAKLERELEAVHTSMEKKMLTPQLFKLLEAERDAAAKIAVERKEEVFQRYKERKQKTAIRNRIANLKAELQRRLTNPTDRSYVPAELATSMADLLDALDTSPREGTQAAAKYQTVSEGLRALAEAYNSLTTDETVGWEYKSEYDEEIRDQIKELAKTMQGRNIRELNLEDLQQVYDAVKAIRDSMRQATKLLNTNQFRDIYEAVQSIVDQQKRMTPIADVSWKERNKRRRLLEGLSVMRAVEMMSGWERDAALYSMFQGVEQGQVDADNWIMGYDKAMRPLKTGKNEKAYRDALTKQMDFGATDKESGKTVKMTKLQAIQLYMTWQREMANDKLVHLQKGGATIRDALAIQNGKGSKAASHTVRVTPELISNIENSLTEWDRAYMKEIRGYLDKEAKAVNRVLYALKHRVLTTEAAYMPYVVDKGYLETKLEGSDVFNLFVKTPGSTQALQKKAPQPVIIDGLDNMMARHVRDQAQYIGLALPIRDFAKVFNGRLSSEDGDVYTSLKKTIEDNFEAGGTHLLVQALLDIQNSGVGEAWQSQIAAALNRLHSSFVKAALLINPSVTIKQAASYIAAESVLSQVALERGNHPIWTSTDKSNAFMPGGLIAHLFNSPEGRTAQRLYDEIDAHTSMHYIRRQGMSHAELANEAQRDGRIKRAVNAVGARMEQNKAGHVARKAGEMLNPLTWIQRMDVATTATLWVACKEQAKLDGMKTGTTEYWNRVTELYERCLRETQPMYDGLHRTAHQKQGGGLMQYLFPFRTVPVQNHGQIVAAYETMKAMKGQSKEKQAAARKFFAKTVWAQTQSAVVFSLMTFLAAALKRKTKKYRDEDEEFTLESFLEGLGGDTASTLFSVAFPMWGSEAWSAGSRILDKIEGTSGYSYDAFTVGAVDMLNELASSGDKLFADVGKMIRGEDVSGADFWSHVLTMLTKGAKIAGIPADTVKTYYAGIKANVQDAVEGRIPALNDETWERETAVNANRFYKAWSAGDAEKMQTVLDEVKASGKSEDSISSAFNSAAKDAYEAGEISLEEYADYLEKTGMFDGEKISGKIKDILKAEFTAGERGEDETINALITYCGMDEDKAWETVQKWEGKAEHPDDEDYSWSKYDDLRAAIDANQDISGIVAELTEHGTKDADIKDAAKKHITAQFVDGKITENKFKNWLARYCGITNREDAAEIVNDAKCKRDTGYTVEKLGEGYRAGDVGKTDAKTALTRYGGLTGTDADKKIRWWDQQKLHPDLQITEGACNNWYDGSSKTRENGHESAKAAGMSLKAYLAAKKQLDKISDANGNSTGEDEYIAALAKMNLTPRQKDALYYEKYKGTTKYSTAKSW